MMSICSTYKFHFIFLECPLSFHLDFRLNGKRQNQKWGRGGGILSGKRGWHRFCFAILLISISSLAFLSDFSKFQFYSYYHLQYLPFFPPNYFKKICQIAANMPSVTPTPGHCANIQNCEESLLMQQQWQCLSESVKCQHL